jgi:hypothetical protein
LVNDSRGQRRRYREAFCEQQDFQIVQGREGKAPVRVRVMDDPQPASLQGDRPERIVLCKSEPRGEKEHAIVSKAEGRFLDALGKLAARVENKRLKARSKIEQAIGRIQARHPRAGKFYAITLEEKAEGLRVRWTRDDERLVQAAGLWVVTCCVPMPMCSFACRLIIFSETSCGRWNRKEIIVTGIH